MENTEIIVFLICLIKCVITPSINTNICSISVWNDSKCFTVALKTKMDFYRVSKQLKPEKEVMKINWNLKIVK